MGSASQLMAAVAVYTASFVAVGGVPFAADIERVQIAPETGSGLLRRDAMFALIACQHLKAFHDLSLGSGRWKAGVTRAPACSSRRMANPPSIPSLWEG